MKQKWLERESSKKIHIVLREWEIHPNFHMDLMTLDKFDIVMVCDDSGSMNASSDGAKTRWAELKEVCRIAVELGASLGLCYVYHGVIDVFFRR